MFACANKVDDSPQAGAEDRGKVALRSSNNGKLVTVEAPFSSLKADFTAVITVARNCGEG